MTNEEVCSHWMNLSAILADLSEMNLLHLTTHPLILCQTLDLINQSQQWICFIYQSPTNLVPNSGLENDGERCLTPLPPRKIYRCPRSRTFCCILSPLPHVSSPSPPRYHTFCPHPHPVTAVVQTRTPHSQAWRRQWIGLYCDTLSVCFEILLIWIYVNSFCFLHFVRNVIVLLIFNIAAFT